MGDNEELKVKKESLTGRVVMDLSERKYFLTGLEKIETEEKRELKSYSYEAYSKQEILKNQVNLVQNERIDAFRLKYETELNKIESNREMGYFKKNKARKQAKSKYEEGVKGIQLNPLVLNEAKVQEAEQNGMQFIASETQYKADLMAVKAMLNISEREYVNMNGYDEKGKGELLNILHSENVEKNIQANKALLRNHHHREEPEACANFMADIELQVNTIPTDVFVFKSPAEFVNNYTNINRAAEKIKAIQFITADPAYAAFIESQAERFKPFIDKMSYFTDCANMVSTYKEHLSSGTEYAQGKEYDDIMKDHTDETSLRSDSRYRLAQMSKECGITLGSTTFEERREQRDSEYNAILKVKAKFDAAVQAYEEAISDRSSLPLMQEIYLQAKIAKVYSRYERLLAEFMPVYGYNEKLIENPYKIPEEFESASKIILQIEKEEKTLRGQIQIVNEFPETLEDLYTESDLAPVFKEALLSRYGKCVPGGICWNKINVIETYAALYKNQEKLRGILGENEVPHKYLETPPEDISQMAPSEGELELMKLGFSAYRFEGGNATLHEPFFRSFSSFGKMDIKLSKEEIVQMLKNLGAGLNNNDDPDTERSKEIKAKQMEGLRLYTKAMTNHYGGLKDKVGDLEKLSFDEIVTKHEFHVKNIANTQVDNSLVTNFPEFFATAEGIKLSNQVQYYNDAVMFIYADPGIVKHIGYDQAKIDFETTKKRVCSKEEFKAYRKGVR